MMEKRVLMVCLGNICRSPMAEGVLRHLAGEAGIGLRTDSAGTSHYHVGEAPDHRAVRAMRHHGIDISDLRARQFKAEDYHRWDLILAMDGNNLSDIHAFAPSAELASKARLIMDLVPGHALRSVPDPYYGGDEGFEQVYHMLHDACTALLNELRVHG